jgi:hypothetical protein
MSHTPWNVNKAKPTPPFSPNDWSQRESNFMASSSSTQFEPSTNDAYVHENYLRQNTALEANREGNLVSAGHTEDEINQYQLFLSSLDSSKGPPSQPLRWSQAPNSQDDAEFRYYYNMQDLYALALVMF